MSGRMILLKKLLTTFPFTLWCAAALALNLVSIFLGGDYDSSFFALFLVVTGPLLGMPLYITGEFDLSPPTLDAAVGEDISVQITAFIGCLGLDFLIFMLRRFIRVCRRQTDGGSRCSVNSSKAEETATGKQSGDILLLGISTVSPLLFP